jgi:hypothetical protein
MIQSKRIDAKGKIFKPKTNKPTSLVLVGLFN